MLSKPLNLILVYILTIFNFVILLLPILVVILPFISFGEEEIKVSRLVLNNVKSSLIMLVFVVSFLMLCYLFIDFIFGFTHYSSLKGCKRYQRIKDFKFLDEIFIQAKAKFDEKGVKLYIKNSSEINAFAIGSLGRKSVVLTRGLINHYLKNTDSIKECLIALRSIIGHEMSHLINKDFLPALLIITNQKVTNFVSRLLQFLFRIIAFIFSCMGVRGVFISSLFIWVYNITNGILIFFNQYIVYNIYEFLCKFVSRNTEYRCDRQSAYAFGGYNMGLALSMLGSSGYFTLFSTHPSTKNRVNRVKNLEIKKGIIRPQISSSVANFISLMFLVLICTICAKISKIDVVVRYYLIENPEYFYNNLNYIKNLFNKIYNLI